MPIIALINIESIVGSTKFFKLSIDGYCQIDDFCEEIKKSGNMTSDLIAMFRILNSLSNGEKLPGTKYHPLQGSSTEYETKKNSLRFYLIKLNIGFVVVLGSKKTEQKNAIAKFKRIHKEYLSTL